METIKKSSGMAIASLVLGILAIVVCLGPLTGIPAIILGHIAYNRSRKKPEAYGGAGLAISGFVLGYVSLFLIAIWAAMLLPALARAKQKAQTIMCLNQMKQIGVGIMVGRSDGAQISNTNSETKGPDGFDPNGWKQIQVLSNSLITPQILICPADQSKVAASDFAHLGPQNVSYAVRSAILSSNTQPQDVLLICPIHNNTLMGDGSVQQHRTAR